MITFRGVNIKNRPYYFFNSMTNGILANGIQLILVILVIQLILANGSTANGLLGIRKYLMIKKNI